MVGHMRRVVGESYISVAYCYAVFPFIEHSSHYTKRPQYESLARFAIDYVSGCLKMLAMNYFVKTNKLKLGNFDKLLF